MAAPAERLDRFLAGNAGLSRGEARRVIERGGVWLDGRRCRIASRPLHAGQSIEVVLEESGRIPGEEGGPAPVVLLDDDFLLALDKPPGLASQGTPGSIAGTLPWHAARILGVPVAQIATVHRLDRDTSGVVVFGKSAAATRGLAAAFREGAIEKEYLAIVAGRLEGRGTIDAPLGPDPARRGSFRVVPGGVPARTEYEAIGSDGAASAVRLLPATGRTHQLRVHLASLGFPIAGDVRYGGPRRAGEVEAPRHMLHARRLTLPHPGRGRLSIVAPLPPDMAATLTRLGFPEAL